MPMDLSINLNIDLMRCFSIMEAVYGEGILKLYMWYCEKSIESIEKNPYKYKYSSIKISAPITTLCKEIKGRDATIKEHRIILREFGFIDYPNHPTPRQNNITSVNIKIQMCDSIKKLIEVMQNLTGENTNYIGAGRPLYTKIKNFNFSNSILNKYNKLYAKYKNLHRGRTAPTSIINNTNYNISMDDSRPWVSFLKDKKDDIEVEEPSKPKIKTKPKTPYSTVEEIPKSYSIQIKRLRKILHERMPARYPSPKVKDSELLLQANVLRICAKEYDWETILKPALKYGIENEFFLENIRSYAYLRQKWKNGETKIQNLIVRWEMSQKNKDSSFKKETEEQKPEDFYEREYDINKFKTILSSMSCPQNKLGYVYKNINTIEEFYVSIPQRIRDYNFFYKSKWEVILKYFEWLSRKVKIENPSYKLLDLNHEMFKRFVEEGIKDDTTIAMSVFNGKYKFRG